MLDSPEWQAVFRLWIRPKGSPEIIAVNRHRELRLIRRRVMTALREGVPRPWWGR